MRFPGFEPHTSRPTSQPLITEGDQAIGTDPRPDPPFGAVFKRWSGRLATAQNRVFWSSNTAVVYSLERLNATARPAGRRFYRPSPAALRSRETTLGQRVCARIWHDRAFRADLKERRHSARKGTVHVW